ncbi:MAG: site-2 protease family protein [Clostridia bacterium]|nr:site-2 protease family protein [Clostridia bacterium]
MLMELLQNRNQLTLPYALLLVVSYVALVLVMMPVHELAHAWAANKLGDNTAYWHGRLRFNPFAHLDPWGTAMIFLFGFGFAKPVPVNPRNFRNPKQGMALTALAGPVSNLLMAAASVGLFRILCALPLSIAVLQYAEIVLIGVFASVNVGLAIFNLIPVPPLDGSKILALVVPSRWIYSMERYSRYITWGIMALLFSGYLDVPLSNARLFVMGFLLRIFGF